MNMECCFRQNTGWVHSAKGEMERLKSKHGDQMQSPLKQIFSGPHYWII